jgi:D-amino-acid oxidase
LECYEIYCAIAAEPKLATQFGLKLWPLISFFPFAIEDNDIEHERMLEAKKNGMRGFRHSSSLILQRRVNGDTGVVDAFEHLSPMLDSDRSMRFLMDLVQSKGAKIVTKTIQGDLWENEDELLRTFQADVILNATGLGSRELVSDNTLYPARSGVLQVINDGTEFERVTHAMVVATDILDNYNVVFIVPRNDKTLILGTVTELNKWTTDLTVDTPIIQKMRKQGEDFYPPLKNARLDAEYVSSCPRTAASSEGRCEGGARNEEERFSTKPHCSFVRPWRSRLDSSFRMRIGVCLFDRAAPER